MGDENAGAGPTGSGPTSDGRWVRLPYSGWGALIASQSPSGWVRRAPEPPTGLVRESLIRGATTVTHRAPTDAESESIVADMRDYLDDAGVIADPWLGAWEVWMRASDSESAWWERVLLVQTVARPRDYVSALRAVLAELAA